MSYAIEVDPKDRLRRAQQYFVRSMLLAFGLSFVLNALALTVPLFMMQLHLRVIISRNFNTLFWLSMLAVGCLILYGIFDYLRGRVLYSVGDAVTRLLDVPLLRAVIAQSLGSKLPLSQNGMRDLSEMRMFMTGNAVTTPLDIFWVPVFLGVLYAMHPLYALTAAISVVVIGFVGVMTEITARRPIEEANQAANRSLLEIHVAIRHAEVIEAMGMRTAFISRWRRSQRVVLDQLDLANVRIKAFASLAKSLRIMASLAEMIVGTFLVIDEQASIGTMVASMLIVGRALGPFEQLVEGWRYWIVAITSYKRVKELLQTSDDVRHTTELPAPDGPLLVDRLLYMVPDAVRPVLRNVSFSLEPGEVLGVIGPSAAGKSSLARMLVGLWRPTSGGVYLDGHNTYQWNRENFGQFVGYLPQSVSLLEGTVADNIARLSDADPADIIAAAKKAGVHEMIGALPNGYETIIGDSLFSLSQGQRQRIGLARALFGNPKMIVLDEPNASLDADGDNALTVSIENAKREGAIVIVISHKPSIMAAVDKIMVMREGAIDLYGPREEVLREVYPRKSDATPESQRLKSPVRAVLS